MSEMIIKRDDGTFSIERSLAKEIHSNHNLQFVYYNMEKDRCMGITPESLDVTYILYILYGKVSVTSNSKSEMLYEHDSLVLDNIQNSYHLTAHSLSKVLVASNTKCQYVNESNIFANQIVEIEKKDKYTLGHNNRVRHYTTSLIMELDSSYDIVPISTAAGLHDIGKINTPQEILQKPSKLTDEEYRIVKKHTIDSYNILLPRFGEHIAKMARQHHERLDGSGYPDGLMENEILLGSKIIAIADVFDALTCKRIYNQPMKYIDAVDYLASQPEKYDSSIVEILRKKVLDKSIFNK